MRHDSSIVVRPKTIEVWFGQHIQDFLLFNYPGPAGLRHQIAQRFIENQATFATCQLQDAVNDDTVLPYLLGYHRKSGCCKLTPDRYERRLQFVATRPLVSLVKSEFSALLLESFNYHPEPWNFEWIEWDELDPFERLVIAQWTAKFAWARYHHERNAFDTVLNGRDPSIAFYLRHCLEWHEALIERVIVPIKEFRARKIETIRKAVDRHESRLLMFNSRLSDGHHHGGCPSILCSCLRDGRMNESRSVTSQILEALALLNSRYFKSMNV